MTERVYVLSCRLAVLGFAVQAYVTGTGPLEGAAKHLADPFGFNIFTQGEKGLWVSPSSETLPPLDPPIANLCLVTLCIHKGMSISSSHHTIRLHSIIIVIIIIHHHETIFGRNGFPCRRSASMTVAQRKRWLPKLRPVSYFDSCWFTRLLQIWDEFADFGLIIYFGHYLQVVALFLAFSVWVHVAEINRQKQANPSVGRRRATTSSA